MVKYLARTLIALMGLCTIASGDLSGFEYYARVDDKVSMKWGDNSQDSDFYQFQTLTMEFTPFLTLQYSAVIKKDLDGNYQKVYPGMLDSSDVMFRDYYSASNANQPVSYYLYQAFVSYQNPVFAAKVGRQYRIDFNGTMFDGVFMDFKPWNFLEISAFGGIPWHDSNANYDPMREHTFGALIHLQNDEENLMGDIRYMFLREELQSVFIGPRDPSGLTLKSQESHYGQASIDYELARWLNTEVAFSMIPAPAFSPLILNLYVSGHLDSILLDYRASYVNQFVGVKDLTDKLTEYSMLMGASMPYQNINLYLYKSIYDLLKKSKFLEDIQLEVGAEKRFLTQKSDANQFNPEYFMVQAGFILSLRDKWIFHLYYDFYMANTIENLQDSYGGEITKKWNTFDMSAGLAFYKYQYQTDYSGTLISDKFDSREVFLKMGWDVSKNLTLKLKGAYNWAKLASLSDFYVDSSAAAPLISRDRESYQLDFTVSLRF